MIEPYYVKSADSCDFHFRSGMLYVGNGSTFGDDVPAGFCWQDKDCGKLDGSGTGTSHAWFDKNGFGCGSLDEKTGGFVQEVRAVVAILIDRDQS